MLLLGSGLHIFAPHALLVPPFDDGALLSPCRPNVRQRARMRLHSNEAASLLLQELLVTLHLTRLFRLYPILLHPPLHYPQIPTMLPLYRHGAPPTRFHHICWITRQCQILVKTYCPNLPRFLHFRPPTIFRLHISPCAEKILLG